MHYWGWSSPHRQLTGWSRAYVFHLVSSRHLRRCIEAERSRVMIGPAALAGLALSQLVELTVSIAPGAIEEPCFPLARNDRAEYEFSASAPLDFNLHYHEDEVFFPVDLRDVTDRQGQYVAPVARTYCLMWTNRQPEPVEVEYRYRIYTPENAP